MSPPSAPLVMSSVVPGLINAGDNSCFLNSVLQALASSQSTVVAISAADRRRRTANLGPDQLQGTLVAALAELLVGLQPGPSEESCSPRTLSSRRVADALRCSRISHPRANLVSVIERQPSHWANPFSDAGLASLEPQEMACTLKALLDVREISTAIPCLSQEIEHSAAALLRACGQNDAVEALELLAAGAEAEMQRSYRGATMLLQEAAPHGPSPLKGLALLAAPLPADDGEGGVDDRDVLRTNSSVSLEGTGEEAPMQECLQRQRTGGPAKADVFTEACSELREWRARSRLPLQGWQAHQLMCARCGSASATQLVPFYVLSLALTQAGRWLQPGCSLEGCLRALGSWELVDHVTCARCSLRQTVEGVLGEAARTCPPQSRQESSAGGAAVRGTEAGQHGGAPPHSGAASGTGCVLTPQVAEMRARLHQLASSSGPLPDYDWEGAAAAAGLQWRVCRGPALKRTTVARAPQVLCLQLRRASWSAATGKRVKLSGFASFPLHLDLQPYTVMSDGPRDPSSAAHAHPFRSSSQSFSQSQCDVPGRPCSAGAPSGYSLGSVFLRQLGAVQSMREAARGSGLPEHEVTGARLRVKPPEVNELRPMEGRKEIGKVDSDAQSKGVARQEKSQADLEGQNAGPTASSEECRSEATYSPPLETDPGNAAVYEDGGRPRESRDHLQVPTDGSGLRRVAAAKGVNQRKTYARSQTLIYDLVAVVVHFGSSSSGHYTTFRRVRDVGGWRWLGISDADVQEVQEHVVLACEATLLCYEQVQTVC